MTFIKTPSQTPSDQWLEQMGLAPLTAEERDNSNQLTELIKQEIHQDGSIISFRRFMEMALYTPQFGYYTGGKSKLGQTGDFTTAPEISPLFGQCIARQCAQVLEQIESGSILEFGAGSGKLARVLIEELLQTSNPPKTYLIMEISPHLRAEQQRLLKEKLPEFYPNIEWLDQLPRNFNGVILANEVLDAMPVHQFRIHQGNIEEGFVGWQENGFKLVWNANDPTQFHQEIEKLALPPEQDYSSEINLVADAWIHQIAQSLHTGMVLIIDYGHTRSEYYHPQRSSGTLLCHFRHLAHPNPLILPGIQDITAHVDFSRLANAAHSAGLQISGYATQGNFLINAGLDELLHKFSTDDSATFMDHMQQVKTLTLPTQMGEKFKVLAMTRGLDEPLIGFRNQDHRHRL